MCSIDLQLALWASELLRVMVFLSLHCEEGPSSDAFLEYTKLHLYFETSYKYCLRSGFKKIVLDIETMLC